MSSAADENDSLVREKKKSDDGRRSGQDTNISDTVDESSERKSASISETRTAIQECESNVRGRAKSGKKLEEKSGKTKLVGPHKGGDDSIDLERLNADKEKDNTKDQAATIDITSKKENVEESLVHDKGGTKVKNAQSSVNITHQASGQNQVEREVKTEKTPCNPSGEATSPNSLVMGKSSQTSNFAEKEESISKLNSTGSPASKEETACDEKKLNNYGSPERSKGLSTFDIYQAMAQQQDKANLQQQDGTTDANSKGDDANAVRVPINTDASFTDMSSDGKKLAYTSPNMLSQYSGYTANPCYYPYSYGMTSLSLPKANDYTFPSASAFETQQPNDDHAKWWSQYYSKYYELMSTTLPGSIPPPPPNPWTLPNLGLKMNENSNLETSKVGTDVAAAPFKKRRVFESQDNTEQASAKKSVGNQPSIGVSHDQNIMSESHVPSPKTPSQPSPLKQSFDENSNNGYSEV